MGAGLNMARRVLLGMALSAAISMPAVAQDSDLDMIVNIWTDDCPLEQAVAVEFEVATTQTTGDLPRCTSIEGLRSGYRLFRNLDGYYVRRTSWTRMTEADYQHVIGLYGPSEMLRDAPQRPTPSRVSGMVGSCNGANYYGGYCHYFEGRYLVAGEATTNGPPPTRLTGAIVRERLGQLQDMEPGSRRDYVEQRATTWLAAVKAKDAAAYSIRFGDPSFDDPQDPDGEIFAIFSASDTVFARLRQDTATAPARIWAVVQPALDPDDEPYAPSDVHALACFQLSVWNEDRWPVAVIDADNDPVRPYACTAIDRETYQGQTRETVEAQVRTGGLAEPDWPD